LTKKSDLDGKRYYFRKRISHALSYKYRTEWNKKEYVYFPLSIVQQFMMVVKADIAI